MRVQLIIAPLLLLQFASHGQNFDLTYTNLTVQDGLAGDNVYFALQDDKGYIWFSTETGVSRYNGRGFENFFMSDGLADNEIFRIDQDSKGRIWFSAFNGKLSYYFEGKFYNQQSDPRLGTINPKAHYANLYEASDGTIWFATPAEVYGIPESGEPIMYSHKGDQSVLIYAFQEDENGVTGLVRDATPLRLRKTTIERQDGFEHSGNQEIDFFTEYILSTKAYLTQYSGDLTERFFANLMANQLPGISTISKVTNEKSHVWFCSDEGAASVNFKTGLNKIFFKEYMVTHVLEDREGGHWFTTLSNGVFYTPSLNNKAISEYNGEPIDIVSALFPTDEAIWFGGLGSKFGQIRDGQVEMSNVDRLVGRAQTKKIMRVSDGDDFLVAAETELLKIEDNKIIKSAAIGVKTMTTWKNLIVLGSRSALLGLTREQLNLVFDLSLEELGKSLRKEKFHDHVEFFLAESGFALDLEPYGDSLLIATTDGLFILDENYEYTRVKGHSLASQRVNDILVLNDKDYVVATHGFGIFIYRNNHWVNVSVNEGLASNITRKVWLQGKDTLWVATNGGISRVLIDQEEPGVSNVTKVDGLQTEEVYDVVVRDNRIYAGTSTGISIIDLDDWQNVDIPPLINFNSIITGNKSYTRDSIDFGHNVGNLQLDYDGLHFKSLDKLTYEYRTLGLDADWKTTAANSINFGKLSPGQYIFQVRAISTLGSKSDIAQRHFVISKPFWLRGWFLLLALLTLIGLVYLLVDFIVARNRQKAQIEFDIKLRLAEAERRALQAQLNPHFIFNSLNSIQNMVLKLRAEEAYDYLEKFSSLIRRVLEFSEKSMVSLEVELTTLSLYIELEHMRLDGEFEYDINIADDVNLSQMLPSLLIQPYVENAIWHGLMPLNGMRKGKLKITIVASNGGIQIQVKDNGVGRSEQKASSGWGTEIARNLAASTANETRANVKTTDLREDNTPIGTLVEINIFVSEYEYN